MFVISYKMYSWPTSSDVMRYEHLSYIYRKSIDNERLCKFDMTNVTSDYVNFNGLARFVVHFISKQDWKFTNIQTYQQNCSFQNWALY